jgi:hypothetical protein
MLAAAHGMVDLASMREQKFYGTWVHPGSKKWHQLGRIFMRKCQSYMINKCFNAEMLKPSDHFSVRINLTISTPPKIPNTVRQKMNGRDLKSYFAKSADENIRGDKVKMIAEAHEEKKRSMAGDEHGKLMAAVMGVLEAIPLKKRDTKGWCDLNLTCT